MRLEVDGHRQIPVLHGQFRGAGHGNAGAVDEHVDVAELCGDRTDRSTTDCSLVTSADRCGCTALAHLALGGFRCLVGTTTVAPLAAYASTIAEPIPEAPPVQQRPCRRARSHSRPGSS